MELIEKDEGATKYTVELSVVVGFFLNELTQGMIPLTRTYPSI